MRTCIRRENKDKYKPDTNDHLKAIREKTEKQRKEEKPLEIYIHQKKSLPLTPFFILNSIFAPSNNY
ncbi:hypothetical protein BCV58_03225 [Bacteroides fragilis]|nr:hypothetical protein BCV58_03225 [Bacteroides fragilis]